MFPSSIRTLICTAAQEAGAHHSDIMEFVRLEQEAIIQDRETTEAYGEGMRP